MSFTYRALTANCGNDTIGEVASKEIARHLILDNADFYILNCQEVAFDKTLQQLQEAIGENYTVIMSEKMATHTKLSTQLHSNTGITTFVIHKNNLQVEFDSSQFQRRAATRLTGGSGYNKGGLVTDLVIRNNDTQESITTQAISGHLDSGSIKKRSQDWLNIQQGIAKDISSWEELLKSIPNLRLSGYDANTRNKIYSSDAINQWLEKSDAPELQALRQVPLASCHYSQDSTYKTNQQGITQIPDKNRTGFAKGGMLDFVAVADGRFSDEEITKDDVIQIGCESGSERDHDVIFSPVQQYEKLSDFARIQRQVAVSLARMSPALANDILSMDENDNNKTTLVQVYTMFLSPKGLAASAIAFHVTKLDTLARLEHLTSQSPGLEKKLTAVLFPATPWFESVTLSTLNEAPTNFDKQTHLMSLLTESLLHCKNQSDVDNRIACYEELSLEIAAGTYTLENATKIFKERAVNEFIANFNYFQEVIETYQPTNLNKYHFLEINRDILSQVRGLTQNNLNHKNLSQLNSVVKQCTKGIEALANGDSVVPVVQELTTLANGFANKPASPWKKLGTALLLLGCTLLLISGSLAAPATGGISLLLATTTVAATTALAATILLSNTPEQSLAASITAYKSSLKNMNDEDEDSTEMRLM